MKLPTILCVVTFTVTSVSTKDVEIPNLSPRCDDIKGIAVRGEFLKKVELAEGLNRPYQLSYYKKNNEIFFSNNIGNDTEDKFEIQRLFHNGTHVTIDEVENGFATAIDEDNEVVYFGGNSGIYKMNLESEKVTKIIEEHDVWDMFFKKHLYFINYPSQKLYKYLVKHNKPKHHKNKEKEEKHEVMREERIHEKIYQFAIDGNEDIFITNETGLFMIKNGTDHRIHIEGEKVFRAIEINLKGEAFFAGKNGIYVVNKSEHTMHKIAHVKNIFGLAFDRDDMIIYSDPLKIIKLLPSECKIADNIATKLALPGPVP